MTPHNHAKPGDYAPSVLLPGDPLRAKWIAENFFEDARQVNSVRNCLGFTGTWKGKPVSVQATGMGQPSLSIYVHELINVYGVEEPDPGRHLRRAQRQGEGARPDHRAGRDHRLRHRARRLHAVQLRADRRFRPLAPSVEHAEQAGLAYHVGNMLSSDIFYHIEPGLAGYGRLPAHGILGVEMEAAALYTLAARFEREGARHLHHDRLPDHRRAAQRRRAPVLAQGHGHPGARRGGGSLSRAARSCRFCAAINVLTSP